MFFVWGWIMGKLTTNRERRNDGRIRYPSSIDGKKYTTRDMVRDNKRRAFPGEKARLEAGVRPVKTAALACYWRCCWAQGPLWALRRNGEGRQP
jgi:hypothetical protein